MTATAMTYDALLKHGNLGMVAVHESGHAAMARLLGFQPVAVNVSPASPPPYNAKCRGYLVCYSGIGSDDPKALWKNALISAAGPVTEIRYLRETQSDPVRLFEVERDLRFDGFAAGDCTHIAGYGRTLFGSLTGDDVLSQFGRDAVATATPMIDDIWPQVIVLAERLIETTITMEAIQPREYIARYQAETTPQ